MIEDYGSPTRWKAEVFFSDYEFEALLTTDNEFFCDDPRVNDAMQFAIFDKTLVSPIGVMPPLPSLATSLNNPPSIASAFYDAVLSVYSDESNLRIAFTGSNILMPGIEIDDVDKNDIDSFNLGDVLTITSRNAAVSKLFVGKVGHDVSDEERDSHGRFALEGDAKQSPAETTKITGHDLHEGVIFQHKTYGRCEVVSTKPDTKQPDSYVKLKLKQLDGSNTVRTVCMTRKNVINAESNTYKPANAPAPAPAPVNEEKVGGGSTYLATHTDEANKICAMAADQRVALAARVCNIRQLSAEEEDSVVRYTNNLFYGVNRMLRTGSQMNGNYLGHVARIDSALERHRLTETMWSYRTITHRDYDVHMFDENEKEVTESLSIGTTLVDKAFMSTSVAPELTTMVGTPYNNTQIFPNRRDVSTVDVNSYAKIGFSIASPPGTPAAYVNDISEYDDEHEILLGRGLKTVVTRMEEIDTVAGKSLLVHITVIPETTTPPLPQIKGI